MLYTCAGIYDVTKNLENLTKRLNGGPNLLLGEASLDG
jgi:hypothetical protein